MKANRLSAAKGRPDGSSKKGGAGGPMTPGRKWIFRVVAAVVLPVLVLMALEIALRLVGYGYDTSFFKPARVGGRDVLVENDTFGYRFFPPEMARLPLPLMIEAHKPADVCRIFIFGESAAEGDPDPAYGPGRFMEVLLRERFPQKRFEIVNVAVTANDSHGILPIARECAPLAGDIWIVYMGNNEMIGPFGAAGVFGQKTPPLAAVRATLAIQETRLGQLLKAAGSHLVKEKSAATEWGGLEMFAAHHINPNDPSKETVYRNFAGNLRDILRAAMDSGANIILNTMAVNLKDCPPLASEHAAGLATAARSQCDQLLAAAKVATGQGDAATAMKDLEQAAAIDAQCAEAHYEWAQSLEKSGQVAEARTQYQLACDVDAIPARTDSKINAIIRQTAGQFPGGKLVLCDAPAILATNGAAGICGDETFYEHVHFNPNGSYHLGRAWAEKVAAVLPGGAGQKAAEDWATQDLCDQRLALTDWSRRSDLSEIVKRRHVAPLSEQAGNAEELGRLQLELAGLAQRMDRDGAARAQHIYVDAIQRAPEDLDLESSYADFLEAIGSAAEAAKEWRRVQVLRPYYYLGFFQEGRMQEFLADLDAAKAAFRQAVSLRPGMAAAWYELGNIAASQGDVAEAMRDVQRASRLQPHLPVYITCLGKLLARMDRHAEAVERFREAVRVDENYMDGRLALATELASTANWPAAQTEFAGAVKLRPDSVPAHLGLGGALASQGQFEAAQGEFRRVMQLDPGNAQAQAALEQMGTREIPSVEAK